MSSNMPAVVTRKTWRTKAAPGALWALPSGNRFRITKDGSRVHHATHKNRPTVLHMPPLTGEHALPSETLRALLYPFTEQTALTRRWLIKYVNDTHYLTLKLSGMRAANITLPIPTKPVSQDGTGRYGLPVDVYNLTGMENVIQKLWFCADQYTQDPSTLPTLDLQ